MRPQNISLDKTLSNYVKALIEKVERRFPDVPVLVALKNPTYPSQNGKDCM
jgi:hypothetical protein